jgi:hypothetical protein
MRRGNPMATKVPTAPMVVPMTPHMTCRPAARRTGKPANHVRGHPHLLPD